MIELLGSVGWGLLAIGAVTHVWHHERLRTLLALHLDKERVPAAALTVSEVALVVAIAWQLLTNGSALPFFAIAAGVLAAGFMVWIGRLLVTGSQLPCACSFSEAPTTIWSLARSVCVGLIALLAFSDTGGDAATSTLAATMAVGAALASAIFVTPEALTWPAASRALMARVDAHGSELAQTAVE